MFTQFFHQYLFSLFIICTPLKKFPLYFFPPPFPLTTVFLLFSFVSFLFLTAVESFFSKNIENFENIGTENMNKSFFSSLPRTTSFPPTFFTSSPTDKNYSQPTMLKNTKNIQNSFLSFYPLLDNNPEKTIKKSRISDYFSLNSSSISSNKYENNILENEEFFIIRHYSKSITIKYEKNNILMMNKKTCYPELFAMLEHSSLTFLKRTFNKSKEMYSTRNFYTDQIFGKVRRVCFFLL